MGRRIIKRLLLLSVITAIVLMREKQVEINRIQIEKMEQQVMALGEEKILLQQNLARWYNYNLDLGKPGLSEAYDGILDLGNSVMAVLEVPEMNVILPVFHGEEAIVGHLPESHLPIGGRGNHTVLTLKAWYPWRKGMAVYIGCLDRQSAYRVESVQVMKAGWPVEWPSEQERLTILSDWGELQTMIRCVRCGELNVRKTEDRVLLLVSALGLAMIFLAGIGAKIVKRWKSDFVYLRKYQGFSVKNEENPSY